MQKCVEKDRKKSVYFYKRDGRKMKAERNKMNGRSFYVHPLLGNWPNTQAQNQIEFLNTRGRRPKGVLRSNNESVMWREKIRQINNK